MLKSSLLEQEKQRKHPADPKRHSETKSANMPLRSQPKNGEPSFSIWTRELSASSQSQKKEIEKSSTDKRLDWLIKKQGVDQLYTSEWDNVQRCMAVRVKWKMNPYFNLWLKGLDPIHRHHWTTGLCTKWLWPPHHTPNRLGTFLKIIWHHSP